MSALGLAFAAWVTSPSAGAGDAAFVERVRAATERYRDRARAIADGYRPIGRDFPGMGEHWVHVGLLFDGRYEPERPEFLSYVRVAGEARLIGVAYGLPLLQGESPPDGPAGSAAWHVHTGDLDEETLLPRHGIGHDDHDRHGPRLVMLHAWAWLDNPEGLFAADNWAIPYVRLGLPPPTRGPVEAGKALSLLSGGDAYLLDVAGAALAPADAWRATLERTRAQVEAVVAQQAGSALAPAQEQRLAALWGEMWAALERSLTPDERARIAELSIR